MYKGIGNSYEEETQTIFISAATLVQGTNIRFVSRNPADPIFSGNNVEGFIQYEDGFNNTVTIFAIASRPVKSGSNVQAVYLYVADSLNNNSPTGEAYLLVFPGFTSVFPGTGDISSSSDPVDNALNSLLVTVQGGSIGNNQTLCAGKTPEAFISLSAGSSTNGAVTYQWDSSTNNIIFFTITGATAATYQAGPLAATTYFRRITIDPGNNTANSNVVTVTVNPLPATPTINTSGATTFCNGASVVLTAPAGASSYAWFRDAVLIGGATAQTLTANTNGAYTVIVTNSAGCSSAPSTAVNVTVNPLPATPTINTSGATTFCNGASVVLTAPAGASSYAWFRDAVLIGGATAQTLTANTNGAYTVIVTNSAGCSSAASTATNVTVNTPPAAPGSITGITETFPTRTNVYSVNPVAGATSYIWTLPSGWTGVSSTNSIQVKAGNTNGIIRVVAVANGCSSPAATLSVKVGLFIADVLTPNGDGFNDTWLIMRPAGYRIGITIYNRWGQVVFRDTDYQNTFKGIGSGSFLGKELPSGTYYYLAEITDGSNASKQVQKGYLTLKREN